MNPMQLSTETKNYYKDTTIIVALSKKTAKSWS